MEKFRFYVREGRWYVDLPRFLEGGGSIDELEMVEGADRMLDIVSGDRSDVWLNLSEREFPAADILQLKEKCSPLKGGAIYTLKAFEGKLYNADMWLCRVTEYVFGKLPERIFLKRIS